MRLATVCVLTVVMTALLGAVASDAHSRVVYRGGLQYRPAEMTISGDGDFIVHDLRWRTWGGKKAVAYGQAIEQERPSHRNYYYPVRVTASRRVYCAALHRTVYNKVIARLLSRGKGVFGIRTTGRVYACNGSWQLVG